MTLFTREEQEVPLSYVSVEHLHRYWNEFQFKYNSRTVDDGTRTISAIEATKGKRLRSKSRISLHPLAPEEVLADLFQVKPETREENQGQDQKDKQEDKDQ